MPASEFSSGSITPSGSDRSPSPPTTSSTSSTSPNTQENNNRKTYRPAIATMSLGKPDLHPLDIKLRAAAAKGFQGVEVYWDDLEAYSRVLGQKEGIVVKEPGYAMLYAASVIKSLCEDLGLQIVNLQPFRNYDGIMDKAAHIKRIEEFKFWLEVADELDAGVIGIPSSFKTQPGQKMHTGEVGAIASDLLEFSALAKPYSIRLAYENLCFGEHISTWQQAWDIIVRTGDLDTIGFMPDTFNICANDYARFNGYNMAKDVFPEDLEASMGTFTEKVPASSIPLLQVADAEALTKPLTEDHSWMRGVTSARMAWSRNARLFSGESKGYLPVEKVVKAVVETGWEGWVSFEVFSRTTSAKGEETIWEHAERGWTGWKKLAKQMGWETRPARKAVEDGRYGSWYRGPKRMLRINATC